MSAGNGIVESTDGAFAFIKDTDLKQMLNSRMKVVKGNHCIMIDQNSIKLYKNPKSNKDSSYIPHNNDLILKLRYNPESQLYYIACKQVTTELFQSSVEAILTKFRPTFVTEQDYIKENVEKVLDAI